MRVVDSELRFLVVEDSEDDLLLMMREIKNSGYQVVYERVETEPEMRAALANREWDLIIADYTMPHFSGLDALNVLRESKLDIPLVIVSGTITDETAVSAMRSGAKDYLMKGNMRRFVPVIEREIYEARERAERRRVEENLKRVEEEEVRHKQESDIAAKQFLKDTVYAVTDGRLNLISYEEAACLCPSGGSEILISDGEKIGAVRKEVTNAARILQMPEERVHALVTAVGEAAANALKHAGGGIVSIYCLPDKIRVCVRDEGDGIESLILPTVTLMTRFSTKRSMGFGYALILASVNAVYLATGRQGTWAILEQAVEARVSEIHLDQLQDVW